MTTNAALAFCSDAWWGLILNVFFLGGGAQGGHKFHWGAAATLAPPLEPPLTTLSYIGLLVVYVSLLTPPSKTNSTSSRK